MALTGTCQHSLESPWTWASWTLWAATMATASKLGQCQLCETLENGTRQQDALSRPKSATRGGKGYLWLGLQEPVCRIDPLEARAVSVWAELRHRRCAGWVCLMTPHHMRQIKCSSHILAHTNMHQRIISSHQCTPCAQNECTR